MDGFQASKYRMWKEGEARREKFLVGIRKHGSVQQAAQDAGVAVGTYHAWRTRIDGFAAKVDAEKAIYHGKQATTERWESGFASFRQVYFGHESPPFHIEIVNAIERAKPGSVNMILMPPEHGKTTLLEDYASMKLALDPSWRITVGSEKIQHGRKVLSRIMHRMEPGSTSKEYVRRFGPFVPQVGDKRKSQQPWGSTAFDIYKKRNHDERDFSMAALGITSAVAGTRTDLLVLDDCQSRKSINITDTIIETLRQDWLTRPGEDGVTWIIGTRVGDRDMYEVLMEEDVIDTMIVYPAIDQNGEPLWPQKWPAESLAHMRKKVGEDAWHRNYMQKPRVTGSATFTERMVERCKRKDISVSTPLPAHAAIYVGVDPNISTGAGRNAVVALAHLADTQHARVVAAREDQKLVRNSDIIRILEEVIARFHRAQVTDVVLEENAFQKGLLEDESLIALQNRYGFRIRGHRTSEAKYDENIGIPSMATDFVRGQIELPWQDEDEARTEFFKLVDELYMWRPNKKGTHLRQDLVMALWFAWIIFHERREQAEVDTNSFRFRAMGYAPTQARPLTGVR